MKIYVNIYIYIDIFQSPVHRTWKRVRHVYLHYNIYNKIISLDSLVKWYINLTLNPRLTSSVQGPILRTIFTRGQFWPSGIVVACVCVCVCVCVCLCVRQSWACPSDNSSTVQARITKFGPEKQNTLVKIPIVFWGNWLWPSRSNLTSNSKFTHFELVQTITHHLF